MAGRIVSEQRMGSEEVVGKGHEGLRAWRQVGASQKQIRPARPGESPVAGTKQPGKDPGRSWSWRVGSLEPRAICMFTIKLTPRAALNNSVGAVISLQCWSLGYKGKGAASPGRLPSPGSLKGRDRWACAGHHPVTLCTVIGFQRRTGFVNGASLLLAAFKWTLLGRVASLGPLVNGASPVGGEQASGGFPSPPPVTAEAEVRGRGKSAPDPSLS